MIYTVLNTTAVVLFVWVAQHTEHYMPAFLCTGIWKMALDVYELYRCMFCFSNI